MPYIAKIMSDDIFNYKESWTRRAMKKRKEKKMYQKQDIDSVVKDMEVIVNKFEVILDRAIADLSVANKQLNSESALAALISIEKRLDQIKLRPIIDTLEGIVKDQKDND